MRCDDWSEQEEKVPGRREIPWLIKRQNDVDTAASNDVVLI